MRNFLICVFCFLMSKFSFKNYILEFTVFFCGSLVMIYEIIGSRILSPYIGTSTYTWTSLIGVILGALSLGYWLGGKLADKKPDVKILASAIFLAGGLVSVTILFKDAILTLVSALKIGLEIKSLIAALFLFAPASVFLGFVTPYAVKLKTKSLDETGKTVGRLYALSTIGSILGTFAAGFFLIPFVGSTRTLYFIAGSLFLISLLLIPFSVSKVKIISLILFLFGIGFNEFYLFYLQRTFNFHDIDTEYSRVQIFDTTDKKNDKKKRVMKIDPFFYQSSMYLENGEPASEYHKFYHLIRHFNPDFQKVLMIGGAGYSFPKEYLKNYKDAEIDVVEIDPQMTELAKKYFRLTENPHLKIFHEDGRVFLNQAEGGKYDAVLIDAFTTLFNIPFQLTTVEAVGEINRVLRDDGIVILNIGGALKGKSDGFLKAEINTYKQIFPYVYLIKVDSDKSDNEIQNWVIYALKKNDFENIYKNDCEIKGLLNKIYKKSFVNKSAMLTDELAPVEYFNSFSN